MIPDQPNGSVLEASAQLWHSARALLRDSAELVSLEFKQAGLSLAVVVGIGIVIGLLAASLWFLLMAAVVIWLVNADVLGWALSLLLVALLNAALAVGLVFFAKGFSKNLLFKASRRQLFGGGQEPDVQPQAVTTGELHAANTMEDA